MRQFRVEYQGEEIHFAQYIEAANGHDAREKAADAQPYFTVSAIVELIDELETTNV